MADTSKMGKNVSSKRHSTSGLKSSNSGGEEITVKKEPMSEEETETNNSAEKNSSVNVANELIRKIKTEINDASFKDQELPTENVSSSSAIVSLSEESARVLCSTSTRKQTVAVQPKKQSAFLILLNVGNQTSEASSKGCVCQHSSSPKSPDTSSSSNFPKPAGKKEPLSAEQLSTFLESISNISNRNGPHKSSVVEVGLSNAVVKSTPFSEMINNKMQKNSTSIVSSSIVTFDDVKSSMSEIQSSSVAGKCLIETPTFESFQIINSDQPEIIDLDSPDPGEGVTDDLTDVSEFDLHSGILCPVLPNDTAQDAQLRISNEDQSSSGSVAVSVLNACEINKLQRSISNPAACVVSPSKPEDYDLHTFLSGTSDGKIILNFYSKNSRLDRKKRLSLSDLIVRNELDNDPNKHLTAHDFSRFASLICEIFPRESVHTYYIPSTTENNRKMVAGGMLYNKYTHLCKVYMKEGIRHKIRKNRDSKNSKDGSGSFNYNLGLSEEEYNGHITWLNTNTEPWDLAVQKWAATAHRRLHQFETLNLSIEDYIEEFPVLSLPEASQLIEIDYAVKYERYKDCLHNVWPQLKSSIISLVVTKLKNDKNFAASINEGVLGLDSENETISNIAAVYSLLHLIPPLTMSRKRKLTEEEDGKNCKSPKVWRASRSKIVSSFLLHIRSASKLGVSIQERIGLWRESKVKCQAYVVLVGEGADTSHMVFFNGKLYSCYSIVSAVDLCFKIYMVFNASYPDESSLTWTFIQRFIYRMTRTNDRHGQTSSLTQLASDLDLI